MKLPVQFLYRQLLVFGIGPGNVKGFQGKIWPAITHLFPVLSVKLVTANM